MDGPVDSGKEREPDADTTLVHHSDRGVQYLAIRYTERLADAGIEPSVGSVGDSYDNALAESVIGLFKTEVIRRRCPWRSIDDVEFAVPEWVDWFNHRRLLEPIGMIPPAEHEAHDYRQDASAEAPPVTPPRASNEPGAVQLSLNNASVEPPVGQLVVAWLDSSEEVAQLAYLDTKPSVARDGLEQLVLAGVHAAADAGAEVIEHHLGIDHVQLKLPWQAEDDTRRLNAADVP